jgi:hypothetical protein
VRALALAALLVTGGLAAQGQEPKQEVEIHGLMGGVASLASDAGMGLTPFIALQIDVPVADSFYAPHVVVTPILTALPGETLDLGDAETFRAIEATVGLSQALSKKVRFSLYGEFGFATRLPGDPSPRNRTARWAAGGLKFQGSRGLLMVLFGADQRLTNYYAPAVLINGVVSLKTFERFKNMNVSLVGSAILGVEAAAYGYPATKDIVRVGISAGL